jgi:hypothetical protein
MVKSRVSFPPGILDDVGDDVRRVVSAGVVDGDAEERVAAVQLGLDLSVPNEFVF